MEHTRYREQPWLLAEYLSSARWAGKKVLEVGVGMGTDHVQLCRAGAITTGIDLTPTSIKLTSQRLAHEQLSSELFVADAEALPFEEGSFDAVYSFGVLHHTPDMQRAIHEVWRVLRPGGSALIGLYNRTSLFYAAVMTQYVLRGQWRTMSLAARRAAIEQGDGTPIVILSTRRQLQRVFAGFTVESLEARHVPPRVRRVPGGAFIERHFGWFWMATLSKPG